MDQGRFKSFPIQEGESLLKVVYYVKPNALRANIVEQLEEWRWCGLWRRTPADKESLLSKWPIDMPSDCVCWVNELQTMAEVGALRNGVNRGAPCGSEEWMMRMAKMLGLQRTLRIGGRA